jgi:uroporphyrinogen-III synthase
MAPPNQTEHGPLSSTRILVTRAATRAAELTAALRGAGADVVEMPATRIERLDSRSLERAIRRLGEYQWAIFTSRTAVEVFWEVLNRLVNDLGTITRLKVAAVGPATAGALIERGVKVEVSPAQFVAEGLLEELRRRVDIRGTRVLYATAEGARDVLPTGLRRMGAKVDRIPIYRSVTDGTGADDVRSALGRGEIDLVTFTSASAVHGYVAAVGPDVARSAPAATIGPVTSGAAREMGISIAVEARESTIPGLVHAVIELVASKGQSR